MAPVLYAIDAHPIVAWLRNEPSFATVQALVAGTKSGAIELRLTTVNAGEVEYGIERAMGPAVGHRALQVMQDIAEIQWVDLELASRAGWLKLRSGLGYADCFAAALAHRDGIPLITGDPDFLRVEDLITVAWLESLTV
jgi:ribonuclease VapC